MLAVGSIGPTHAKEIEDEQPQKQQEQQQPSVGKLAEDVAEKVVIDPLEGQVCQRLRLMLAPAPLHTAPPPSLILAVYAPVLQPLRWARQGSGGMVEEPLTPLGAPKPNMFSEKSKVRVVRRYLLACGRLSRGPRV